MPRQRLRQEVVDPLTRLRYGYIGVLVCGLSLWLRATPLALFEATLPDSCHPSPGSKLSAGAYRWPRAFCGWSVCAL